MKSTTAIHSYLPRSMAALMLAASLGLPAFAQQQPAAAPQTADAQQQATASTYVPPAKEGFWGHMNPFARKKWVKRQVDPLNDHLSELDQVNAKNARDIKDVDGRAQAGINKAQSAADAANQTALAAGDRARQAGSTAESASNHVGQLDTTVSGLDQYHSVNSVDIHFRTSYPALSAAARKQLDDLASSLSNQQGYILELEAHSPAAGSAGIQNSRRLAEAVQRYLVAEHQIPVYRMHSVALGNARMATTGDESAPVKTNTVHLQLMVNSLAAQEAALPHGVASSGGAERP